MTLFELNAFLQEKKFYLSGTKTQYRFPGNEIIKNDSLIGYYQLIEDGHLLYIEITLSEYDPVAFVIDVIKEKNGPVMLKLYSQGKDTPFMILEESTS